MTTSFLSKIFWREDNTFLGMKTLSIELKFLRIEIRNEGKIL